MGGQERRQVGDVARARPRRPQHRDAAEPKRRAPAPDAAFMALADWAQRHQRSIAVGLANFHFQQLISHAVDAHLG